MKNVDLIVEMLRREGVRWVFGVPSGPVLPLIEALREAPDIEYVLTASETSAGFMASTVGALTGVPGVCVATLGPGATNLATGVGAAWLDRTPVIAITCNVGSDWLDRRIQMRIDHNALFAPITKATFMLQKGRVAATLAEALTIARQEPPGPVHLDLPEDVGTAAATEEPVAPAETRPIATVDPAAIDAVARALSESERPLLVAGLSMTRSRNLAGLRELVEKLEIPFVTTMHGKGLLPESHPNFAGVIGRARRSDVHAFVQQADLILAIGYDPIEINYEEWVGDKPVVHISTETADTGPKLNLLVNAAGDIDDAVEALSALELKSFEWRPEQIDEYREALDAALRPDIADFGAQHVLDRLRERLEPNGLLAYDVGAHTHQIASQWRTDLPNSAVSTNGWSSMGYGIPGAYAAKLVHPERQVVGVIGDGCFLMTAGELSLGRRMNIAAPIVVLNDGWLSLIKVKQERREYELSGVRLNEPAPSPEHYFGVPCRAVHSPEELDEALEWALALDGPSVIEAFIDASVYSTTVYD